LVCALVAGCGGNDDGKGGASSTVAVPETTPSVTTETPPVDTTPQRNRSTRKRSGSKPRKTEAPSKSGGSTPQSRQVERYLRDNFGTGGAKTDWYGHVVEVSVSGTATTVRTDLSTDSAGKSQARQICESVRGTIPGLTDEVRVTGLSAGSALAKCVP
jgi:hypothetical protein